MIPRPTPDKVHQPAQICIRKRALLKINKECKRPRFNSWVGKISWRRDRLPTPVFLGFPCGSAGKEFACNAGDLGSIPGLERYPGEGKGYPLQYYGLENSMDYAIHGVAKSQTRLSDFHFTSVLSGSLSHHLISVSKETVIFT